MTLLSRRQLLSGVSATAASAWLTSCGGPAPPGAGTIEQTLASHFGADVARSDPARRFATDLAAHLASGAPCISPWGICETQDARIVQSFLESTTFLASRADGSEFDYLTIFDPWLAPCGNQLSAPV